MLMMLWRRCYMFPFCLSVYAGQGYREEPDTDGFLLKFAKGLTGPFKSGYPKENISSLDPYEETDFGFKPSFFLGRSNETDILVEIKEVKITGLSDRDVINATKIVYPNR